MNLLRALLHALESILSALDINLQNSAKRRWGVTPGEELHQYNLRLVLWGRISTLGSNSTLHARLTYPPGRPQWKTEGVHGSAPKN